MKILPDGSGFFVASVEAGPATGNPIHWNPGNKVVQDHRTGEIIQPDTDRERAQRGLPVPWTPEMADKEVREPDLP